MTLRQRRIYYTIFIIIFFISAPILILYSAGYRYDFARKKLIKAGSISIVSKPDGAAIYLNGQKRKEKTPARIKNILPDDYEVKVEKEGYYPWEKKLAVGSEIVTFASDLILFKNNSQLLNLENQPIAYLKASPDQQSLVYFLADQKELWQLKFKNDEKKLIESNLEGNIKEIQWSPDNKKILVSRQIQSEETQNLAINLDNLTEIINLNSLDQAVNFSNLKWDKNNSDFLFGYYQNELFKINLKQKKSSLIFKASIADYYPRNDTLYYFSATEQGLTFKISKIDLAKPETKEIVSLAKEAEPVFLGEIDGYLLILDKPSKKLYLFEELNQYNFRWEEIDVPVKDLSWSNDQKKILYYNDFEIWIYDLVKGQKELINRSSLEIKKALEIKDFKYVLFDQEGMLKIIERDGRDKRNQIELLKTNSQDFVLDDSGENLYLLAAENNINQLFKLQLQ